MGRLVDRPGREVPLAPEEEAQVGPGHAVRGGRSGRGAQPPAQRRLVGMREFGSFAISAWLAATTHPASSVGIAVQKAGSLGGG